MDCLSKEQLLLLQQHLNYDVYEQFINMFEIDKVIPDEGYNKRLLELKKKHPFWGVIKGWGKNRKYIRIDKRNADPNYMIEYRKSMHPPGIKESEYIKYLDEDSKHSGYHDWMKEEEMLPVED